MPDKKIPDDIVFDFPEPTPETKRDRLSLWATYYHVYSADVIDGGQPLFDNAGNELGPKLSDRDFCLAAVEGTVRVDTSPEGGVVYNYASHSTVAQVDCSAIVPHLADNVKAALGKTRWAIAEGPFGDGVEGMILVPYRTIAVDPGVIPFGTVIYIPEARGRELPLTSSSSAMHDGYFYAADTGGAIKQNHIDVFAGITKENPFPSFVKSNRANTFEAFLISDPKISAALNELHGRI
jgi:3D (Asp-Asp-Asp) domain-containing protein